MVYSVQLADSDRYRLTFGISSGMPTLGYTIYTNCVINYMILPHYTAFESYYFISTSQPLHQIK